MLFNCYDWYPVVTGNCSCKCVFSSTTEIWRRKISRLEIYFYPTAKRFQRFMHSAYYVHYIHVPAFLRTNIRTSNGQSTMKYVSSINGKKRRFQRVVRGRKYIFVIHRSAISNPKRQIKHVHT